MEDISIFGSFAKGAPSTAKERSSANCVIYTRVSSKEQADKNMSLETQRRACNEYARKYGLAVVADFGGTYESAKTDERREFKAMIDYVKRCREKVSCIIVYSLERFSRNDNSIWLSGQLRKLNIEIISVTQPIDTSSPAGQMQQKMLFLFGEFDNELRRQKCMAGMRDKLLDGDWPTMQPLGFDRVRVDGKKKIVVNAKGKLLREAFLWKAHEGVTNETIRARLAERGLKLNHQRISEIFRNPFYCGLIVHRMLEGKVVKGNQEQLVSHEVFLKVNGLLDRNTHGYTIREENEAIPLKRFVHCDDCGKPMRGYIVRKKGIHYYKCSTVGCCNNKNAKWLNDHFMDILDYFRLDVDTEVRDLIRTQTIATFNQHTQGNEDRYRVLHDEYAKLQKKITRLEERFIEEEINRDLFNRFSEKFALEKKELEASMAKASERVSNLDECIDLALDFASEMPSRWDSSDYITKQGIQNLVFPEGIRYIKEKRKSRTTRINSVFLYIAYLQQVTAKKERGIPELSLDYASFADLVAGSRIELPTSGL